MKIARHTYKQNPDKTYTFTIFSKQGCLGLTNIIKFTLNLKKKDITYNEWKT